MSVNGKVYNLEPNTPAWTLSVGALTTVVTWPGVSYATLTPQTATIVIPRLEEANLSSHCGLPLPPTGTPNELYQMLP